MTTRRNPYEALSYMLGFITCIFQSIEIQVYRDRVDVAEKVSDPNGTGLSLSCFGATVSGR
jgi:hypothetical protein